MRGKYDKEKILEAEIVTGRRSVSHYHKLSKGMDFVQLKKQTETAIEVENIPAIQGLALSNSLAVAEQMSSKEGFQMISRRSSSGDNSAPNLFFMLRGNLSERARPIFRRLARQSVLKVSRGITGKGLRGDIIVRTEYHPGIEDFDDELTLENYMENQLLTYEDIVAIERREKSKSGVLIFDTSGSLYGGKFTTAALAVAIMAYHLEHDNFAVVLFNTKSYLIKRANEKIEINELINRILDSESAGYTNINEALEKGGIELKKMRGNNKFAILVTDGVFNKGGDPRRQIYRFPKLHILGLPTKHDWGRRLAQDMARRSGGRFAMVSSHEDVPKALMNLLRHT
ncbi:MAG: VWA domain-containing protein [Candidatus Heimdallarchaeota archaeon]|nr:VWA domain-containing protein [Candidatus Heimdallarchaeota archaeon]MDH5646078.1 VWA domain-containing protein [Candidatus Heimdallarchaeota archaeon]